MSIYDVFKDEKNTFDSQAWSEMKQKQRKEAYELIDNTCAEMAAYGDIFRTYLDVQARFDRYSVANAILVSAQMPEATCLKEYKKWKENRVFLKKGAEKITILEPGKEYIREDGKTATSFNAKDVYDISQTSARGMTASKNPSIRELLSALVETAKPVQFKQDDKLEVTAFYDSSKQTIFVKTGVSEHSLFAGTAKEVAAALYDHKFHEKRDDSIFKSYCVSYMLCSKYGIDTKNFSFDELPEEFKTYDEKALRSGLNSMRDVLGDINDVIYKCLENNKPAKSKEQER